MAYDEHLAARISDLIHARPGVVERRMRSRTGSTRGAARASELPPK